MKLQMLLQTAAVIQIGVALLNFFLVRMLGFRPELERVPLLLREIVYVHACFISATLLIFGLLTWRFAAEIGGGTVEVCRWVAACIGFFWALRTGRTLVHCLLLLVYGGFTCIYLSAAFG